MGGLGACGLRAQRTTGVRRTEMFEADDQDGIRTSGLYRDGRLADDCVRAGAEGMDFDAGNALQPHELTYELGKSVAEALSRGHPGGTDDDQPNPRRDLAVADQDLSRDPTRTAEGRVPHVVSEVSHLAVDKHDAAIHAGSPSI